MRVDSIESGTVVDAGYTNDWPTAWRRGSLGIVDAGSRRRRAVDVSRR